MKAKDALEVAHGDSLLDQVQGLQEKAPSILVKAEAKGDLRAALGAIREARGNLELLAKLLGMMTEKGRQDGDQRQINFIIGKGYADSEWGEGSGMVTVSEVRSFAR